MALGEVIAQQAPMFPPLCPPLFPPYDVGPVAVVVLDAKLSNIADKHGITVVDAVATTKTLSLVDGSGRVQRHRARMLTGLDRNLLAGTLSVGGDRRLRLGTNAMLGKRVEDVLKEEVVLPAAGEPARL